MILLLFWMVAIFYLLIEALARITNGSKLETAVSAICVIAVARDIWSTAQDLRRADSFWVETPHVTEYTLIAGALLAATIFYKKYRGRDNERSN